MPDFILDVQGLETTFKTPEGVVHAVNGVSFGLAESETFGVVGESGCGKSVTMLSILGLIASPPGKVVAGTAHFFRAGSSPNVKRRNSPCSRCTDRHDLSRPDDFSQSGVDHWPSTEEPLMLHIGMTKKQARTRAAELMSMVGIPNAKDRLNDYPHQYSGGMRQRVMIAMALSCSPQILIADEPTTALDVTIQAQITDLVKRLRDELGMAIIWITHDLGVVAGLAQRVMVMYGGYMIEEAPVNELYANPEHPYTIGLLGSLPRVDEKERTRLHSIEGQPPGSLSETDILSFCTAL